MSSDSEARRPVMTDIEKTAATLTDNMVLTMIWWSKGGTIQCDVPKSTQTALVKRGLAFWPPNEDRCADLTELGLQVQAYLAEKAKADQYARDCELAAKFAAERKIRDEGYESGWMQSRDRCLLELNRAVYGCDTWPDRPHDSVWEYLLERVRKAFGQEEVA
jgi:hypothetical protein